MGTSVPRGENRPQQKPVGYDTLKSPCLTRQHVCSTTQSYPTTANFNQRSHNQQLCVLAEWCGVTRAFTDNLHRRVSEINYRGRLLAQ